MKKIVLILLPLLMLHSIILGQTEKTFVKSVNLFGRQTVVLNLGENITLIPTDNDFLRVQMTVKLPAYNEAMLKAIAETGRYILKTDITVQEVIVTAPNLTNTLKLNNIDVQEFVAYQVFVPKSITVLKNTKGNTKAVARLNP
jgi:hypothetical protein